ncbi:hypothetical protein [Andreprevotia chitinilytica]|uniref:hypothetical protein n=1 Tax=Andreprevotia chitinilytica TaxID=396808 RepID=UPI0005549234|nr:hypothetical protein [Andreprevotia chitinilytica]
MSYTPRFRFSESAAVRKHVLRVPTELIEHLIRQPAGASTGMRWLQTADLAELSESIQVEGRRLLGMYVYVDDAGTVTEIGIDRAGVGLLH